MALLENREERLRDREIKARFFSLIGLGVLSLALAVVTDRRESKPVERAYNVFDVNLRSSVPLESTGVEAGAEVLDEVTVAGQVNQPEEDVKTERIKLFSGFEAAP